MSIIDLTTILGNLAQSLLSIERLVEGLGFMLGIGFVFSGLIRLTKINKYSHDGPAVPLANILGGAVLIYFPSAVDVISNTFFGSSNILSYANYSRLNFYDSIGVLIQTAGVIWFVRGAVLLVHASEPGKQKGFKGFLFIIAGVLSMNFSFTVGALNAVLAYFVSTASKVF